VVGLEVGEADATAMPFPDGLFPAVLSFTMLHHVPSVTLQDQLLAEAWRVLRAGGVFAGSDTALGALLQPAQIGDTVVSVGPAALSLWLKTAGFDELKARRRATTGQLRSPSGQGGA
jgi:SAM-dependent methyltransferase